jgi:hypothetical protein
MTSYTAQENEIESKQMFGNFCDVLWERERLELEIKILGTKLQFWLC